MDEIEIWLQRQSCLPQHVPPAGQRLADGRTEDDATSIQRPPPSLPPSTASRRVSSSSASSSISSAVATSPVEVLFNFFICPHSSPFVIRLKKQTGHWLSIQFAAPNWLDNQLSVSYMRRMTNGDEQKSITTPQLPSNGEQADSGRDYMATDGECPKEFIPSSSLIGKIFGNIDFACLAVNLAISPCARTVRAACALACVRRNLRTAGRRADGGRLRRTRARGVGCSSSMDRQR